MNSECCMIWGAGYCGGIALGAYGADRVICFGDSDERNIGQVRWGKPIISYDEMIRRSKTESIRIVAASEDYTDEMEKKLSDDGIRDYDLFVSECAKDIIADIAAGINPLEKNYFRNIRTFYHDELRKFCRIHEGRRIFLIGNGPSLRAEDLDTLYINHEICFGFNSIHSIFDHTKWRPDYYGISDYYGFLICREMIDKIPGTHFMWDLFKYFYPSFENDTRNYFFRFIRRGYSTDEMPEFSDDVPNGLNLGYSVTYDIGLQMAAYMGASEIYLLGMDHNYIKDFDGNHFEGYSNGYGTIEAKCRFYPVQNTRKGYDVKRVEKAFERAKAHSEKHNYRIFNATRGGMLEIFERVNFDKLF